MNVNTATLPTRNGTMKQIKRLDPVWDTLDNKRARFIRLVDETTIEIADNEGRTLPDYRHISQVFAY